MFSEFAIDTQIISVGSNYKTEITRDRYQSRIAKVDKGNLNLTPIGHREKRKIEKNKHRIDDLLRPSDFKWQ